MFSRNKPKIRKTALIQVCSMCGSQSCSGEIYEGEYINAYTKEMEFIEACESQVHNGFYEIVYGHGHSELCKMRKV